MPVSPITVRVPDATSETGLADVVLTESSRAEITAANPSVTLIKTEITNHANNNFTAAEAENIALWAADIIAQEELFI